MHRMTKLAVLATLVACAVTPAIGYAKGPPPNAPLPAKAKAYGRYCQNQSKKHVAGQKGTPWLEQTSISTTRALGRAVPLPRSVTPPTVTRPTGVSMARPAGFVARLVVAPVGAGAPRSGDDEAGPRAVRVGSDASPHAVSTTTATARLIRLFRLDDIALSGGRVSSPCATALVAR